MKLEVVVVRDRAAVVYGQPYFVTRVGAAIRAFSDEINRPDEKNPLYKHPEDFDLYYLGTFDDESGTFETEHPRQIAVGKDVSTTPR